jgi:hypothetical protein
MRIWVVLALARGAVGCLEGFYGPACLLCPGNSSCNGITRQSCPSPLGSAPGSRDCYAVDSNFSLNGTLSPLTWSGPSTPYAGSASCGCFRNNVSAAVVMDFGRPYWIGGVATASLGGAWVRSYMASVTNGTVPLTWRPVGGLFLANVDDVSVVESKFPYPVLARHLRLEVVDFFLWPSLRAVALRVDGLDLPGGTVPGGNNETTGVSSSGTTSVSGVLSTTYYVSSYVDTNGSTSTGVLTTTSTLDTAYTSSPRTTSTTPGSTFVETTSALSTTAAPRRCRRLPNTVAAPGEPCALACAPGTYNHSGVCVALPRRSPPPSRDLGCAVRWSRRPVWSRVHAFGAVLALETRGALRGDMALRLNNGPWMAWSWRPWAPVAPDASPASQWLLLPEAAAFTGLWLRALNGTIIVDIRRGRCVRHWPSALVAPRPSSSLEWAWGFGGRPELRGDSQALCALRCGGGSVAATWGGDTLWAGAACAANATAGVPWLQGALELRGVDSLLQAYLWVQCSRGTQAWVVPGSRRDVAYAGSVKVECIH